MGTRLLSTVKKANPLSEVSVRRNREMRAQRLERLKNLQVRSRRGKEADFLASVRNHPPRYLGGYTSHADSASRNRELVEAVFIRHDFRICVPGELFRDQIDVRVQGIIPLDHLAGIGTQAAQDGCHRASGAILSIVQLLIVTDGVEQGIVLLLVSIPDLAFPEAPRRGSTNDVAADIAGPLGSDDMFRHAIPAALDMTAEAEQARAILVFKLDSMMVENLAIIESFADLATAHALRADGMTLFDPIDHIKVMDVLLDDVIATNPSEVVPIAHLIFHLGELAPVMLVQLGAALKPRCLAVPIGAHGNNVPDSTVMQSLDGLEISFVIMSLQPNHNFQILLLRFFCGGKKSPDAGSVGRHRLFRKNIFPLPNGLFKLHGTESRRRRQNHYIGQRDGLFISLKPDELALR